MALTVLTDEQIRTILENLTREEYAGFRESMARTLHEYSTKNNQAPEEESYHQPHRVSTQNHTTGATTLYMPSCSPLGMGCKGKPTTSDQLATFSLTYFVTLSSSDSAKPPIKPTGAITLLSPRGKPVGFVHAKTLTAFRTAAPSTCLLARRSTVETITVFGSGLQAYWHVRLALLTRGSSVRHVNVIVRSLSDNAKSILAQFQDVPAHIRAREGWADTTFSLLASSHEAYPRLLCEQVCEADVIFCCTPSREDLFNADILTSREGSRKARLVVAIGSYTPEMRELPEELLLQATKREGSQLHFHKHEHASDSGVIIVDTRDGILKEAGEVISAGIQPSQMVELGELVEILRQMESQEASKDASLAKWLRDGTVIYKSVGLGLMDLAVGMHLIKVAEEKGVGTRIDGF
ncbi:NAD(P)-binding protein [Sodiomyces alkalinus F11]|uniref:NAD(P)-binding protein n=1 Tax=Sodiomyces alkalinus (strain CBS 110278 / VKM F-3762 / F11) TaxID=1314773 RepID=A0A3N2PQ72_SODAK|nr:NAD(P)-binding protein [Sodiomyces alkalinus F11]ROT36662.1 NAD(P)-binding protein [Sodiomyces alkalinus F11]